MRNIANTDATVADTLNEPASYCCASAQLVYIVKNRANIFDGFWPERHFKVSHFRQIALRE